VFVRGARPNQTVYYAFKFGAWVISAVDGPHGAIYLAEGGTAHDVNDKPCVLYWVSNPPNDPILRYSEYITSAWVMQKEFGDSSGYWSASLAIDGRATPLHWVAASFYSGGSEYARIWSKSGGGSGTWTTETTYTNHVTPSIAVDSAYYAHVALAATNGEIKYVKSKSITEAGSWPGTPLVPPVRTGEDPVPKGADGRFRLWQNLSVVVDKNDNPTIGYSFWEDSFKTWFSNHCSGCKSWYSYERVDNTWEVVKSAETALTLRGALAINPLVAGAGGIVTAIKGSTTEVSRLNFRPVCFQ
jgi:hypothetical protein